VNWQSINSGCAALYRRASGFVTKTAQRKWSAVGASLGLGLGLIFAPSIGIAAFGGAIAGRWIVVAVITVFGALIGNRLGVEVERRRDQGR